MVQHRTRYPVGFYFEEWSWTNINRRGMIGKCQISGREYPIWCLVADIYKYINRRRMFGKCHISGREYPICCFVADI